MHEKKADLYHIKLNIDIIEHPYKSGNIYIYIYTTSEKPVNDQSYGVLGRYGITILYK